MQIEDAGPGPFWVYVLRSSTTGKKYTGQTDDLSGRLIQHNTPEHSVAKFTTENAGPWMLIHAESYPSRAAAMLREKWLKSGVGREWIAQLVERSAAAD